jgi:hypothetical protein
VCPEVQFLGHLAIPCLNFGGNTTLFSVISTRAQYHQYQGNANQNHIALSGSYYKIKQKEKKPSKQLMLAMTCRNWNSCALLVTCKMMYLLRKKA